MIPFFARCILKEKIKKVDLVAIIISFVGMILIIQPFGGGQVSTKDVAQDLLGVGLSLLAAAAGALSVIYNR